MLIPRTTWEALSLAMLLNSSSSPHCLLSSITAANLSLIDYEFDVVDLDVEVANKDPQVPSRAMRCLMHCNPPPFAFHISRMELPDR